MFDKSKIAEFEKDLASNDTDQLRKKWGIPRHGLRDHWIHGPYLGTMHWVYTLRAHVRGRIHARKIGQTHVKGVPCHTIDTLEQQELLADKFITQFKMPEAAAPGQVA